jgi:histone acetyltransferase (RNA polymerase elongator complex component)
VIIPIFLPHMGCLSRCTYCDQEVITERTGSDIRAQIDNALGHETRKVEVGLFGGNIFGIEPKVLEKIFSLFDPYRDRIKGFRISTKPVPLIPETIKILKECGTTTIELGIPSFNDMILEALNRDHTVHDLHRAFAYLKDTGFHVALQVMAGLPGETTGDVQETVRRVVKLRPYYLRIYPLVVFRDTPLGTMYEDGRLVLAPAGEVLAQVTLIYLSMVRHGIDVVKIGLTENEIVSERVIGGYYHPAFGYAVKCHAFYLALKHHIGRSGLQGKVGVRLNARDIPHLVGDRRSNLSRFQEEGVSVTWQAEEMEQGAFILEGDTGSVQGTILDALQSQILNPES